MLGLPLPIIGISRLPPFSYSGTFSSDLDGWAGTMTRSGTNVRTSPGSMGSASAAYAEYTIPKETCGGLTISASIWHRTTANTTRTLSYKIGSGSFVTLATVSDKSGTYAQLSGGFDNPGDDDIIIRAECTGSSNFDDWEISGA